MKYEERFFQDKETYKVQPTKLSSKTLVVFEDFIRTREVILFVEEYRKYLGISDKGLEISEDEEKALSLSDHDVFWSTVFYVPKQIFPLPDGTEFSEDSNVKIVSDCEVFLESYGFTGGSFRGMFRLYVLFNKIFEFPLHVTMSNEHEDLAAIEYLPDEITFYKGEEKGLEEYTENTSKRHPIALYFSPEASLNEIKDFLSKNWDFVESKRDQDKLKYYTKRKKRKQELNDFIYDNRNLKASELFFKVSDKFGKDGVIDVGHIGKILSLEKRKRGD